MSILLQKNPLFTESFLELTIWKYDTRRTNNYDHFHNFPVKMIHFLQLLADVEDVQKDIGFFASRTLLHLSSRVDVVDRQTDSSY